MTFSAAFMAIMFALTSDAGGLVMNLNPPMNIPLEPLTLHLLSAIPVVSCRISKPKKIRESLQTLREKYLWTH